ncbi:hypothetical protein [Burkholderia ambifaria]|uniref:hypothetical protein n=1 Tax=Burkholderia ambifaria TaxID=152480 RepID=UPI000F7FB444|nr:hypothetical protein [Burkholderia ambifaria]
MLEEFMALLRKAEDVFVVGELSQRVVQRTVAPVMGVAHHLVITLGWQDEEGKAQAAYLTEAGIAGGTFNEGTGAFEFVDRDGGHLALRLHSRAEPLRPHCPVAPAAEGTAFVLIQEGGSSEELYVHSHDSREAAEQDRIDCWTDGAYRTSEIIEVPASLANQPGFYEFAESLLKVSHNLDGVEAEEIA